MSHSTEERRSGSLTYTGSLNMAGYFTLFVPHSEDVLVVGPVLSSVRNEIVPSHREV